MPSLFFWLPMRSLSTILLFCILAVILAPLVLLLKLGLSGADNGLFWPALWRYGSTTLILVLMTVLVSFLAGVIPAFLISIYRFPGRNFFRLSLLLPLALPSYLLAYVYGDFFEFAGPVQSLIRDLFGYRYRHEYIFFEVRSMGMAALLLGVGLSPYVFAFTLASLDQHARNAFDTARVLGLGSWRGFLLVIIPLARPAWATGLLLVAMETIADFGTVQHLAVDTLTLGIFNTWLERGDLATAARLALFAGTVVLLVGAWERHQRGQRGFQSSLAPKLDGGLPPARGVAWSMAVVCFVPLAIGFLLPVLILLVLAVQNLEQFLARDFLRALGSTLSLAGTATVSGTVLAVIIALGVPRHRISRMLLHGTLLGYMLPGTIFALGLMLLLKLLGATLDSMLLGGVLGLLYGYVARFFALSHGVVRNGVETIPASIDDAGALYGCKPFVIWFKVKLPILRGHLLCAMIILFVEVLKELPLTLIMRPAGMETLATHLYHFAGDENLAEAAPGALVIILMGVVAVSVLAYLRKM